MKVTRTELKQLVKEELEAMRLHEGPFDLRGLTKKLGSKLKPGKPAEEMPSDVRRIVDLFDRLRSLPDRLEMINLPAELLALLNHILNALENVPASMKVRTLNTLRGEWQKKAEEGQKEPGSKDADFEASEKDYGFRDAPTSVRIAAAKTAAEREKRRAAGGWQFGDRWAPPPGTFPGPKK